MPNYAPSTIARIGDLINGARVETSALAAATYMLTGPTQTEIFNVFGRVKIHELFGEVADAAFSAHACVLKYTFTSSSPVIAVADLSAVTASLTGLAIGERITWLGGAVATAAIITATPGISSSLASRSSSLLVGCTAFVRISIVLLLSGEMNAG